MTIRLSPLVAEHIYPLLLDLAFFVVCFTAWLIVFGNVDGPWPGVVVLAAVVVFHVVQMTWLLALRFDDDGITIIRPWRRQRVAWSQVAGLIFTKASGEETKSPYKLRLVLAGNEPPSGRYATGPVVMMMTSVHYDLHSGPDSRTVRCQQLIYAELERRGLPKPPPYVLEYRCRDHA